MMISDRLGIGQGTALRYKDNVVDALASLIDQTICWPDSEEREALCQYAEMEFGFKNCFFAVDGTTHPLAEVPSYDKETFFDRKSRYSLQALVTCDWRKKVINLILGWPGSVHDARVLSTAEYISADHSGKGHLYFTGSQYGLGDAAFGPSHRVIPTYKAPQTDYPENVEYNNIHGSLRVRVEHVNGMVKCRFQGLRELRFRLNDKKDAVRLNLFVLSGYVLHNILVDLTDDFWEMFGSSSSVESCTGPYDTGDQGNEPEVDITTAEGGALFREQVKEAVLRAKGYSF